VDGSCDSDRPRPRDIDLDETQHISADRSGRPDTHPRTPLRRYSPCVYRALVMFPKSANTSDVDALIEGIASSFRASAGSQPMTRSVGSLMGPGAKAGEAGWILEADFPSLEDAMSALHAEDFQAAKERTETLGSTIFLFEVREV